MLVSFLCGKVGYARIGLLFKSWSQNMSRLFRIETSFSLCSNHHIIYVNLIQPAQTEHHWYRDYRRTDVNTLISVCIESQWDTIYFARFGRGLRYRVIIVDSNILCRKLSVVLSVSWHSMPGNCELFTRKKPVCVLIRLF